MKDVRWYAVKLCDRSVHLRKQWLQFYIMYAVIDTVCRGSAGDKIEKNEMGWACGAYG